MPSFANLARDAPDDHAHSRSMTKDPRMHYGRSARLAKSLLEPRVVAYGHEIVVPARLLAEGWVQLH